MIITAQGRGSRGRNHTVFSEKLSVETTILLRTESSPLDANHFLAMQNRHIEMRGGDYNVTLMVSEQEILTMAAMIFKDMSIKEFIGILQGKWEEIDESERHMAELSARIADVDAERDEASENQYD